MTATFELASVAAARRARRRRLLEELAARTAEVELAPVPARSAEASSHKGILAGARELLAAHEAGTEPLHGYPRMSAARYRELDEQLEKAAAHAVERPRVRR